MANNDVAILLSILQNEEELIMKPFQSRLAHEFVGVECGRIVSRLNKPLFDYQIGNKAETSMISSIFHRRIKLIDPETKKIILELYHNRLPLLLKVYCKEHVRCLATLSNEVRSIGSIQQKLAFAKICYSVYNNKREHVVNLMLRKRYLRSKFQHRILEFEIFNNDKITKIGRIYSFSTDSERTEYGHAVAMKIPQEMKVEIKATLLIAALLLKSRLN